MDEKEEAKRKSKELSDGIAIKGYVTIWQGEGKEKRLICRRKENHWVDNGIKGLISALIGYRVRLRQTSYPPSSRGIYYWSYSPAMYLGTDTVTATTHAMTALTSPIGTPPGTAQNSFTGENRTNPVSGTWKTAMIAKWYAGTVSGTVGELALYLRPFTNLTPNWEIYIDNSSITFSRVMVSRLSEADTDFSSFVIDPAYSLTVQWDLEASFA